MPDFVLPSFLDFIVEGEAELKHVMPWDEIPALSFVPATPDVREYIPTLQRQLGERLAGDEAFRKLVEDIRQFGARRDMKTVTLNKASRIALRKEDTEWSKRSEEVLSKTKMGKLQYSHDLHAPSDDIYTRITFDIVSDLITLEHPRTVARDTTGEPPKQEAPDAGAAAAPEAD